MTVNNMPIQEEDDITSVIDLTALILVNMKASSASNTPVHSPRAASSPPSQSPLSLSSSPVTSPAITPRESTASPVLVPPSASTPKEPCECMLCTRGSPVILNKCHTWAWIMRVVFYSLREKFPEKKFFSLKNDVYDYMMQHWNILGLDRKPSANWHKQIQDMLSHSRNIFESGMSHYKQNGFWRLRDLEDPWTASPDAPRPPSTTPPTANISGAPNSPKKRTWKHASSDSDDGEDFLTIGSKKQCTPPMSPRPSSSPLSASPRTASFELDKEVAVLREQLQIMSEHSFTADNAPKQQFPFAHNRAWEEAYTFGVQNPLSVQA